MGKLKLSLLLICTIILTGIFASCNEKVEPVEIKVNVKFVYKNEVLGEYNNIVVKSEDGQPTVINAVERACSVLELSYELSDDQMSVRSVGGHEETDTGLWLYKINGEEPKDNAGKAGNYEINDGDTIYFYFDELQAETNNA